MTDKQIIIDGVDIKECAYFRYPLGCNSLDNKTCQCMNNDCDYKELKRKEQECERLKNAYEVKEDALEESEKYSVELEEKCHKLKRQLEAYKMEAEEGKEINAELKAENEELKDLNTRLDNQRETYWKEYQKLKQALTEIKEIAYELTNEEYTDFIKGKQEQILQKISEVLDV